MIGDTYVSEGEEFEVVWSGGEGLVPPRDSKIIGTWIAPKRMYNKTGRHSKNAKCELNPLAKRVCELGTKSCIVRHRVDIAQTEAENDGMDEFGDLI